MSKRRLLSYSHAFLVAANEHAAAARGRGVDGEVDGMMCVIALQSAVVGATKLLGNHPAGEEFLTRTQDLKNVRDDMVTHFDDYARGTASCNSRSTDLTPG